MNLIGIDFSLNSPSICIDDGYELHFFSFFNTEGECWNRPNPLKKFKNHNNISNIVHMMPYERHKNNKKNSYAQEQSNKMDDASMLSKYILDILNPYTTDSKISLEGFAYSSSGSAFIDLILFNSFLRKSIIEKIGPEKLEIIAPATAKKLAGKGNADKNYMINAFKNNVLNDEKLEKNALYQYINNTELDIKNIKPIDDLVDSYFIMRSMQ